MKLLVLNEDTQSKYQENTDTSFQWLPRLSRWFTRFRRASLATCWPTFRETIRHSW